MAELAIQPKLPDGTPITGRITATIVSSETGMQVWAASNAGSFVGTVTAIADASGRIYTIELEPNSGELENTEYILALYTTDGAKFRRIKIPSEGIYDLQDVLL